MTRFSDFEFAGLNGIEVKKVKELEEQINRQLRVNNGREIYLMAFTPKERLENQAGSIQDEAEPVYDQ